jgi:hypothetical protein
MKSKVKSEKVKSQKSKMSAGADFKSLFIGSLVFINLLFTIDRHLEQSNHDSCVAFLTFDF